MKKILVLAAGLLQIPVIRKAREMGYRVIAADGSASAEGLKYADRAFVADITSEEKMLALARAEKIDAVIHPCSEVSMAVMGRINDELGLSGIGRETALKATNKHLMREAFKAYGAPSPRSWCTTSADEAWKIFRDSMRTAAILKPSRNSGSRGIAKVTRALSETSFKNLYGRALKESRDASVMIEQFIEGPEFSVEIIVWQGVPHVLSVTDKKTTGAPYFVELGHNQPSLFPEETVKAVAEAACSGVKALGLDSCAAHAEVKVQNGEPFLMEIGARLGGDFISTTLVQLSTGIDMVAAAISVAFGEAPDLTPKTAPQGVCIRYFAPNPGRLKAIQNQEILHHPEVFDAELYRKPGDVIPPVRSSTDRSGHVIVTAPGAAEAVRRADEILSDVVMVTEDATPALYTLLSAALTGKVDALARDIDWTEIIRDAGRQGVTVLASDGLQRLFDEGLYESEGEDLVKVSWFGHKFKLERQHARQQGVAAKVAKWLSAEGVRTLVLKGATVAECYPVPSHRYSSDLDIFPVRDGKPAFEESNRIMESHGIKVNRKHYKNSSFRVGGVLVEDHHFCTPFRGNRTLKRFERLLETLLLDESTQTPMDGGLWRPAPLFTALFLAEHAYSHFLHEGLIIRHVTDWQMFRRAHQDDVDWVRFEEVCDEFGFADFMVSLENVGRYILRDCLFSDLSSNDRRLLEDILKGPELHTGARGWKEKVAIARNTVHAGWKYRLFSRISMPHALWIQVRSYFLDPHPTLD